jgi:hypothetical protein
MQGIKCAASKFLACKGVADGKFSAWKEVPDSNFSTCNRVDGNFLACKGIAGSKSIYKGGGHMCCKFLLP